MYFCRLEVNLSNRVLRRYAEHADRFMRVSFVGEVFEKVCPLNLYTRGESLGTTHSFMKEYWIPLRTR